MIWHILRIIAGAAALRFYVLTTTLVYAAVRVRPDHFAPARGIATFLIFGCALLAAAIFCSHFAIYGHIAESRRRVGFVATCAFILGGISFIAGFFIGLMNYSSPQAPFLCFILGPIGFSLGSILSATCLCLFPGVVAIRVGHLLTLRLRQANQNDEEQRF